MDDRHKTMAELNCNVQLVIPGKKRDREDWLQESYCLVLRTWLRAQAVLMEATAWTPPLPDRQMLIQKGTAEGRKPI